MNPPCKGCKDRPLGCHSTCEVYKDWKKPIEARAAERESRKITDDFLNAGHYRGWRKYKKK